MRALPQKKKIGLSGGVTPCLFFPITYDTPFPTVLKFSHLDSHNYQ